MEVVGEQVGWLLPAVFPMQIPLFPACLHGLQAGNRPAESTMLDQPDRTEITEIRKSRKVVVDILL